MAEFDEELGCGREVVDHDADVLHAFDRHALDVNGTTAPAHSVSRLPIPLRINLQGFAAGDESRVG